MDLLMDDVSRFIPVTHSSQCYYDRYYDFIYELWESFSEKLRALFVLNDIDGDSGLSDMIAFGVYHLKGSLKDEFFCTLNRLMEREELRWNLDSEYLVH